MIKFTFYILLISAMLTSCTVDNVTADDLSQEIEQDSSTEGQSCGNITNFIFNESNGLVSVEFEDAVFDEDWKLKTQGAGFSGKGYMVWEGSQNLSNPGNGVATFNIKIQNPGTYQFLWYSAVKIGNNGTDHNDTWLRFNDADDFYAQKDNSVVYPKDTGKSPNPAGATKDGWFKIYRSGNNLDYKWEASTFDNNGHDVHVVFENPGTYIMEVSPRSSGHAIDKFVLFNENVTQADAISQENKASSITCN